MNFNDDITLSSRHPALAGLRRIGLSAARVEQVLRFYDEPHRCYHDRRHLREIFVEVTLKDQSQATHTRFEARMKSSQEVVECFLVSGSCDYVLRLACRDLDHYRELTNAWTDEVALGVEKIASKPELQTVKPFRGYPLP